MDGIRTLISIALLIFSVAVSAASVGADRAPTQAHALQLPLAFEANQGQTDARVQFLARAPNYTLFLTPGEAVFALSQPARSVMRMQLVNGARNARVQPLQMLPGKANYLRVKDAGHSRIHVPLYERVEYTAVYPGIDLIYYGQARQLEYDFIVAAGADPGAIRLAFTGVDAATIDTRGDLVLKIGGESMRFHEPLAYQIENGHRRPVESGYRWITPHEVGFRVGEYDPAKALIIDPVLSFSTHLGGGRDEFGNGIAVDPTGSAYVIGWTNSVDFPTENAARPTYQGGLQDAFVAKLTPEGDALVYATYIGGSGDDVPMDIAVDRAGAAYITGTTNSWDFSRSHSRRGAFCGRAWDGLSRHAFVTKLSADGSRILYSRCLAGSREDVGRAIAVDDTGAAYVVGSTSSCDFPTVNAYQPTCHAPDYDVEVFLTKLRPDGRSFAYSTFLGGGRPDEGSSVAVDSSGAVYVGGFTLSFDFPLLHPAQPVVRGPEDTDGFVTKFAPDGKSLIYSMVLGGSANESVDGIAAGQDGVASVVLNTTSDDFPTVNALQPTHIGSLDAYVAKIPSRGGPLIYGTFLGSSGRDEGFDIAVDTAGAAYITGWTFTPGFPAEVIGPGDNGDAFVAKLVPNGSALAYATRVGGSQTDSGVDIAVDLAGAAYIAGFTYSADFPTLHPLQPPRNNVEITDTFVTKLAGDTLRVAIDVKPRGVHVRRHSIVAVAILSSATFDATTVSRSSVRFGDSGASPIHAIGHVADVNHDAIPDLILAFRAQDAGVRCGDAFATLTATTLDGRKILGADTIATVGCGHE